MRGPCIAPVKSAVHPRFRPTDSAIRDVSNITRRPAGRTNVLLGGRIGTHRTPDRRLRIPCSAGASADGPRSTAAAWRMIAARQRDQTTGDPPTYASTRRRGAGADDRSGGARRTHSCGPPLLRSALGWRRLRSTTQRQCDASWMRRGLRPASSTAGFQKRRRNSLARTGRIKT